MKPILILLLATGLFATAYPLTKETQMTRSMSYQDWCIDGYQWRVLTRFEKSTMNQIFKEVNFNARPTKCPKHRPSTSE